MASGDMGLARYATSVPAEIFRISRTLNGNKIQMDQMQTELELAWEEVSFWQDFVADWKAKNQKLPEPRVREALEAAWRRYERALHLREGHKNGLLTN